LHALLGDWTRDPVHRHEAALARPDLATTRAALGCALGEAKRAQEAVPHLRYAVEQDPFDRGAARALYQALIDAGKPVQAEAFREERLLLHRAAPTVVPADDWLTRQTLPVGQAFQPDSSSCQARKPDLQRPGVTDEGALLSCDVPLIIGKGRVSLCIIAKNEEANIAACLDSAADLCDEVVVLDTGSTDRTREIARDKGARVFEFPWIDHFAAARNACLEHATGDWIFWLDADDRLDEPNRDRLRRLFDSLPAGNVAFSMKCRCLPDPVTGTATTVDHIRLFRNSPRIRWRYRVHEQILGAVRESGGEVLWADVVIQHTGYTDAALRRRKLQRDLRLLEMERSEQPHDPFTLFNLGASYAELARYDEALPMLQESLARSHPRDSIVRKLYALVASCHLHRGRMDEALRLCLQGQAVCADDEELLFLESLIRTDKGDLQGARAALVRLLGTEAEQHFASVADGLRGHKGRHQLAVVCCRLGENSEAELLWHAVLRDRPDYLHARVGLGEMYLSQHRWAELEEQARALRRLPQGEVEAILLHGKMLMARREFAPARALLEDALVSRPGCLPLLMTLSHVLLREDRDHAAARRVLLEILTHDPDNAQARQYLEVLRRVAPWA
jgi:tetratricopeptide (TPR) repeat protein